MLSTSIPTTAIADSQLIAPDESLTRSRHRVENVDGINIAYREAGDPANETIVLLHGFPTSSHMFRDLIPVLAEDYHVLAPDYPGYGRSDAPALADFDYSFATFAELMNGFLEAKGEDRYALYLMDYGAPVGFRVFAENPDRVTGFVIQNGNAYEEGLREFWDPLKTYWANPTSENGNALRPTFEYEVTQWQYSHGVPEHSLELVSPDDAIHAQFGMDRPGNRDIQLQMFLDYGTNVPLYADWQKLFREHQPPALVVWGVGDHIFPVEGASPYARDLDTIETHLLDTGHFALETHRDFIAAEIIDFIASEVIE
ncbi:alpha/beta fold hydrolase [Roseovarius tolerans]|nr:alpha/beta hydrolase [Roseovarius tolerans]